MGNLRGRPVMDSSRRKRVSVRLNDEEYEKFVTLGGVDFVRNILAQAAKEKASVDALAKVALGGQPEGDKEKEIVA